MIARCTPFTGWINTAKVVVGGTTWLLLSDPKPGGLSTAIASLLDDSGKACRMGEAAREHVAGKFTMDRCADSHERLY